MHVHVSLKNCTHFHESSQLKPPVHFLDSLQNDDNMPTFMLPVIVHQACTVVKVHAHLRLVSHFTHAHMK